jgi:hypothetical protein
VSHVKKACDWLWILFAVVLLAAPAVLAQDGFGEDEAPKARKKARARKARRKRAPRAKPDVYAKMAEVLTLEGDAKAKFDAQVAENKKAVEEWQQVNGEKLKELQAAMRTARKEKDKDKAKTLGAELRKLQLDRKKLETELMGKVLALLTDEQKATWAGCELREQVLRRYRRCKLSEDQVGQVQKLCEAVAKELGEGQDRKAKAEAMKKLNVEITEKVLTEEQRQKLAKRGGRARGEGKAKPRRGKKKAEKAEPEELGNPEW